MDKAAMRGRGTSPRGLKHRLAQMLLRSSCTATGNAAASNLIKLSSATALSRKSEPRCSYCFCKCEHRVAPVVQVDVHCGARHSIAAAEPVGPLAARAERMGRKKERRMRENGELYETGGREGRKCPPASPSTPTRNWKGSGRREVDSYYDDEEDDSVTLFSSKSFSSDSSEFYGNRRAKLSMKSASRIARGDFDWEKKKKKKKKKKNKKAGARVGRGVALVKDSRDPYRDFRSSMEEMIAGRKVSSGSDMEELLDSYLSLNSPLHHPVILEAFVDVWEETFLRH